jgi:hypothetical protein
MFENVATATAPAQRVHVDNEIDPTKFDMGSLRFTSIKFGATEIALDYPSAVVDELLDLRPAIDLLAKVDATAKPSGKVELTIQALDPSTLLPPDNPLVGFLPPDVNPPEGQGELNYTVSPKAVPAGTELTNQASIIFDDNDAITTPVWSNKIDRSPPSPQVSAAATSSSSDATVTWGGSDDASGISRFDLLVSEDGGEYKSWMSASNPGSQTFHALKTATYRFRTVAHDGAGNINQASSASIALAQESPAPSLPGGGTQPNPPSPGVASPPTISGSKSFKLTLKKGSSLVLPVKVSCPGTGAGCTGMIEGLIGKVKGASGSLAVKAGSTGSPKLTLTRAAVKSLKKKKRAKISVSLTVTRGTQTVSAKFTLTVLSK